MSFDSVSNTLGIDQGLNINLNIQTFRDSLTIFGSKDILCDRSSFNDIPKGLAPDTNGLVNHGELINGSDFNGTSHNSNISIQSVDFLGNGSANTNLNDWFTQNLIDSELISKTRNLAADNQLSRQDIIAIFRDAEDRGVVDANELKDLRTIVRNYSRFNIQDYTKVLANKVINGDVANAKYQGVTLGNLYAGSSSNHMEKLISKWFFGGDHPAIPSNYTYQKASGSLFQNGVNYSDVNQGNLADCYFLAGLAEVAYHSPSKIQSMFIDNGDNTYTVRFYKNGVSDYVTVDKYLPTNSSGKFAYANSSSNELWVALAEKAYAQINESGWIGQNNTNSYQGIEYGFDRDVIQQLTGRNANSSSLNFNSMVNSFKNGTLMGVSSYTSGVAGNIVPNHVYAVVGYDSSTQKFSLYNPWGINGGNYEGTFKPGTVKVSFAELQSSFSSYSYTSS